MFRSHQIKINLENRNIQLKNDKNFVISGIHYETGKEVSIETGDGLIQCIYEIKNAELNCLAGASLPLKKGVETMMNFTRCSLSDAINMASKNVARIYGLKDRGSLAAGKRADIIMFEKKGNQIIIKETWLKGTRVF